MSNDYIDRLHDKWVHSADDASWTEFLDRHVSKMHDFIEFWSYCTRIGMNETCPERTEQLRNAMIEFEIPPWFIKNSEVSNG